MGEQIERKAMELVERIRKRMRPRVSQEKIGEYLWPRRYDDEGYEVGDPQKSYSLLVTPRKGKEPRRLKLGEFIDACDYLGFDPIHLLTLAKLATEQGLDVDAMLGEQADTARASPPARTRKKASSRARTTQGSKLGHDSK